MCFRYLDPLYARKNHFFDVCTGLYKGLQMAMACMVLDEIAHIGNEKISKRKYKYQKCNYHIEMIEESTDIF